MISRASTLTGLAAAALLAASSAGARGAELAPGTQAKVIVRGYDGDVMEPFLTRDGKVLLFNNSNARPERTNLHAARAVSSTLFAYAGLAPMRVSVRTCLATEKVCWNSRSSRTPSAPTLLAT